MSRSPGAVELVGLPSYAVNVVLDGSSIKSFKDVPDSFLFAPDRIWLRCGGYRGLGNAIGSAGGQVHVTATPESFADFPKHVLSDLFLFFNPGSLEGQFKTMPKVDGNVSIALAGFTADDEPRRIMSYFKNSVSQVKGKFVVRYGHNASDLVTLKQ